VTGTAILCLAQDGVLDLDDPVARFIPELAGRLDGVTLRHLLTHTSGIPSTGDGSAPFWRQTPPTEAQMLHALDVPLSFPPGRQHAYSNAAVALAGLVVSRAAHEPYRAFVRARIFERLGMHTVAWERASVPASHLALGVGIGGAVNVPHWELGAFEAAGGMYASIDDMAGLARLAFGDAPQVLSQASISEALTDGPLPGPYGISWRIGEDHGERYAAHSGSTQDYSATLMVMPEQRLAAIVLSAGSDVEAVECVAAGLLRGARTGRLPPPCPRAELDTEARAAADHALDALQAALRAPSDATLAAAFAPTFLTTVPRAEIDAGIRTIHDRFGSCDRHRLVGAGGLGVRAELTCERGIVHLEMHLEDEEPHRIDAFVSPDMM
jgi:CubicO group peptidase (beta-lactamase class C family)